MITEATKDVQLINSIKEAAIMMMDDLPCRMAEFHKDLELHMSTRERGSLALEVREAVQELVDEKKLIIIGYKTNRRTGKLIAPAGFQIL